MNDGPSTVPENPANWREALVTLAASRFAIFEHEAKTAARGIGRAAMLGIAAIMAFVFFWILANAALVGWLASATALAWYQLAGIIAGVHLVAGVVLLFVLRTTRKPSFAITREEFRKDRAWLSQPRPPKSND